MAGMGVSARDQAEEGSGVATEGEVHERRVLGAEMTADEAGEDRGNERGDLGGIFSGGTGSKFAWRNGFGSG